MQLGSASWTLTAARENAADLLFLRLPWDLPAPLDVEAQRGR